MKNLWTTILVKDLEASIKFYTEVLGLSLVNRFQVGEDMAICFLGDDETKFELIKDARAGEITHSDFVSTGFSIDSVDDMLARLKGLGVPIALEPVSPNPHMRYFVALDPNGYRIQLVERIA